MKIKTAIALIGLFLFSFSAYAHHPAADVVDADIYATIDEMVSDTPHADLFTDEMGGGETITTITGSLRASENLLEDGLVGEVSELDGDVYMTIEFTDNGGVVMTISQSP